MHRDSQPASERSDGTAPSNRSTTPVSRGPMILTGPVAGDRPVVFRVSGRTELNGPDLLIQVCLDRGWILFDEDIHHVDNWNIWWRNSHFSVSQHRLLQPWQFVNHIPRANSICRKDCLARHLQRMSKVYGNIYNYSPQTYNLPLDYTKLVAAYTRMLEDGQKATWICKPVGASQGKGITIFSDLSTLQYDSNAVVQRYISNPLLIAGYKFDLRIYVCIPSYHPLTVYIYEEGLARFSTEKYNMLYLDNKFSHLTNTSLNKLGPGYFAEKERIGAGSKWTLSQLRHYFHQAGIEDWLLWQRINTIVSLTVLSHIQDVPVTRNCYELYGFDILVDSDLRPWLMEVNLSPSLTADVDVDMYVKKPLLNDLFDLIGLPASLNLPTISPQWPVPDEKLFTRPKTVMDIREQNAARRLKKEEAEEADHSVDDEIQSDEKENHVENSPQNRKNEDVDAEYSVDQLVDDEIQGDESLNAAPDRLDDKEQAGWQRDGMDASDADSRASTEHHLSDDCLRTMFSSDHQMSTSSGTLDGGPPDDDATCNGSEPGLVECCDGPEDEERKAAESWEAIKSSLCACLDSSEKLLRSAKSKTQTKWQEQGDARRGSPRAASVDRIYGNNNAIKRTKNGDASGASSVSRKRKSKERASRSDAWDVRRRRQSRSPSEDAYRFRGKRTSSATLLHSERSYASSASDTPQSSTSVAPDADPKGSSQGAAIKPLVRSEPKIPVKVQTFLEKLRVDKESQQKRAPAGSQSDLARSSRAARRTKRRPQACGEGRQSMASAVTVLVNELGAITTLRPVSNLLPSYLTCQTHYLVPKVSAAPAAGAAAAGAPAAAGAAQPPPAPSPSWTKPPGRPAAEEREMLMLAYNWHAFHNKWGNGRDWRFAPPKVGGWCRTFPFNSETRHACQYPIDNKTVIAEVSQYLRHARRLALRAHTYDPDELTRLFKARYCRHGELWMPCM